jgi:hypothetical protein
VRAVPGYNAAIMSGWLAVLLTAAVAAATPLTLETELDNGTLTVSFQLHQALPESLEAALPSGASVQVNYQVRVRSKRKLWWDKKVWKGDAIASTIFDPVTGRYRNKLTLDGVIVSSHEVESADEARDWLANPGPVRFALSENVQNSSLKVRVRAVFSSSTQWLFFPDIEGTKWLEIPISPARDGAADDTQGPPSG